MFLPREVPEPRPSDPGSTTKYPEEVATITHGRGLLCDTLRLTCAKRYGPEAWEELRSRLSEGARGYFKDPVGDFAWVPIGLINELEVAFGEFRNEGRPFYQGQALAEQQLKVAHPWLLKLLSPEMIVRQGGTLFRFYYKGGVLEIESVSRGHGTASIWALGMPKGWYVSGASGWYSQALRMAGAQKVDIQHEEPPVEGDPWRHRYTILWE
ncbi:MAG TPA: hypothetical protein VJ600_05965 [Holophagaceae bacterium]|nr:hypothetical protein [Holophagaceae bacterium]